MSPSRPEPKEKKINLNLYLHTSLWWLKGLFNIQLPEMQVAGRVSMCFRNVNILFTFVRNFFKFVFTVDTE